MSVVWTVTSSASMSAASANGVGLYVIRGNHEADVSGGLAAWGDFFSGSAAMPTNGPSGEVGLTYSFATNNALVLGLDACVATGRLNQAWFTNALAASIGASRSIATGSRRPATSTSATRRGSSRLNFIRLASAGSGSATRVAGT